jgi:hypothetical protein
MFHNNNFILTQPYKIMNPKFKRHQKVKLLITPFKDRVEPYHDPPIQIKAGMTGKINIILPNGDYHVEIIEENSGEKIAYVSIDEDGLEALEELTD